MTSAAALFSEVILILGKYVIRCFTYNSVEKKNMVMVLDVMLWFGTT